MIARAIADPATLTGLIAIQEATGFHHRVALYRRALGGDLRLIDVPPGWRIARDALWESAKPTVIVLGDDAGISAGPRDFPDAERLLRWAHWLIVHAMGAEVSHYMLAAEAAAKFGRVVLIETGTAQELHWIELANRETARRAKAGLPSLGGLVLRVHPGLPAHPLVGSAAA